MIRSRFLAISAMLFLFASLLTRTPVVAAAPCVDIRIKPTEPPFCLELAADHESRRIGLQHRRDLPPRGGMLFVFPETASRVFWMQDTHLELDIIFLNEKGRIVCLASRVVPSSIKIGAPARYVVELAGGTAERLDLWPGDLIVLPANLAGGR